MGCAMSVDQRPEPSHAWTCHCGKRIIAFLNAVWPGETWRTEESKFNAAVAAHQMECSDGV